MGKGAFVKIKFDAHDPQVFNTDDARNFVKLVQEHFEGMLVPRAKKPTVTYGDCIDNQQQVVVIISDSASDGDKALAEAWYEYPANTPQGKVEREDSLFWMSSECFLDRYSDIRYGQGMNLQLKIDYTLQDQEKYLEPPQPGEVGHRDLDKFWVTQAVLNYDAVPFGGHSMNYWGSMKMNPFVTYIYEDAWRHGHTYNWDNKGTQPLSAPNILLFDFAGDFDGFPEACVRMLK